MIEQTGVAVTFYAQFLVSGAVGTGLTITCTVYKGSDGSALVSAQAATEIGGGLYKYTYATPATEDDYLAVFNEDAATADQTDVPAMWTVGKAGVENLDASVGDVEAKIDLLGSATVITTGPVVTAADTLELVREDDYKAGDGRAVSFSSDSWPDLTGATVTMTIRRRREAFANRGSDSILASKDDSSGLRVVGSGTQTIYFDLTTTETTPLLPGTATGNYDVEATLSNSNIVTLITGLVSVTEDQTRA